MAKKNYNLLIGVCALLGVVLLIALVGYLVSKPRPRVIQGEAEATEYRISCMVPGHVTELYCREGQPVHKGDTVAFIDSPQVRAKLAQAQAARSAAQAQSVKASNGARKEQIAGAYELWQQALVQEDVMKKSFERVKKLYDQKVISAQKYDETKAQYDAAVAQAKAAKSQYDMALDGARAEERPPWSIRPTAPSRRWIPICRNSISSPRRTVSFPAFIPGRANWWARALRSRP